MGIAGRNLKQMFLYPAGGPVNAALPFAPTTTAVLAPRYVAPCNGKLVYAEICIAVASAIGNSVDVLDTLKIDRRGVSGAATAVNIAAAVNLLKAAATSQIRAAGELVKLLGLAGNHLVAGEIFEFPYTETGTLGTGTRATFQITRVLFEADAYMSEV